MGVRSETRTIGGIEITVTQLPARRALRLMTKLARAIIPVLEKGISGADDLIVAMPVIIGQLEPDEADQLACDILSNCSAIAEVNGKRAAYTFENPTMIDAVFTGNMNALMEALVFGIEVNFGNFIGGGSEDSESRDAAPVNTKGSPEFRFRENSNPSG